MIYLRHPQHCHDLAFWTPYLLSYIITTLLRGLHGACTPFLRRQFVSRSCIETWPHCTRGWCFHETARHNFKKQIIEKQLLELNRFLQGINLRNPRCQRDNSKRDGRGYFLSFQAVWDLFREVPNIGGCVQTAT